jgi:hypothetical protein
MKNIAKLFIGLLLLTGIVFTGCEEVTELTDVKFPANYETELDVIVTPTAGDKGVAGTFSVSETINPADNPDYSKYLDKIKGVTINEVSGLVLSINPNMTLTSTTIRVSNESRSATWEYTNLPISLGSILTLDNDNGQWTTIEQILMDKKTFTVEINGQADKDNAEFVVSLVIESDITANPLN